MAVTSATIHLLEGTFALDGRFSFFFFPFPFAFLLHFQPLLLRYPSASFAAFSRLH